MPQLEFLSLEGPIHSKRKRHELREKASNRNVTLVVSPEDEQSTSEEEVEHREEDEMSDSSDVYSDV